MRGISTWAVAVRKPSAEQLAAHGRPRPRGGGARARSRSHRAARLVAQAPPRCCACRSSAASSRSASRSRSASGRSASPPTPSCPTRSRRSRGGMWAGTIVVALLFAVGLFFLVPVGAHDPDQGPARLRVPLLARRGPAPHGDLPRLPLAALAACATCAACSSTTAPSTRRSPATRPAMELTPANAAALLAPASALRDELPADRDDRRDLRLRADRPARLVLAARSRASSASR